MTVPRGPQPFPGQEKRLRLLAFVRQDSIVRVDKRVEDTAMVWPHLLVIEFIAAMVWALGLFVVAALFNAPLMDRANVDRTPNPSKAPWYFLNLQELLLHMNAALAGVIVPTAWIVFMMTIPYIDRSREGVGVWFTSQKGKTVAVFSAVYSTVLTVGLVAADFFLKKAGYAEWATAHLPGGKLIIPDVVIPVLVMLILPVVLVVLLKRLYQANTREWMIGVWTGFLATYVVLTFIGTSMRGPGMDLFAPWALPPTHD
ncbi:MAG: menaquinol-cytochrome C reductase [Chloroflexi bacterium]|nr:menaquinol-cytochrome C reductase [Chloroflexota bacterium]